MAPYSSSSFLQSEIQSAIINLLIDLTRSNRCRNMAAWKSMNLGLPEAHRSILGLSQSKMDVTCNFWPLESSRCFFVAIKFATEEINLNRDVRVQTKLGNSHFFQKKCQFRLLLFQIHDYINMYLVPFTQRIKRRSNFRSIPAFIKNKSNLTK